MWAYIWDKNNSRGIRASGRCAEGDDLEWGLLLVSRRSLAELWIQRRLKSTQREDEEEGHQVGGHTGFDAAALQGRGLHCRSPARNQTTVTGGAERRD